MMIPNLSKEKNIIKKSLFQKNSNNYSNFSLKRKTRKNIIGIKNEELDNNKLSTKYSFFYRLKEKEKNPSKTPYLDRKGFNSTYNLKKYDFSNVTNFIKNKND